MTQAAVALVHWQVVSVIFCVKSTSKAVALPMMFDLLRSS